MGRQSSDLVTISNSLFYGNNSNTDGGAICIWNVQPGSELNLVNSTLYGNFTNGNAGHGGGLAFMTGYETYLPQNMQKNIYNSILDGNYAVEGGSLLRYSDLTALYGVDEQPDKFNVKNSFIGSTVNMIGKPGIDLEANKIDYYTQEVYDDGATAGLDDPDYYAANYFAIPLLADAESRTYGDPQYLIGTVDLSGKPRTIADGKCAIGASEVTSTELDEGVTFETGIPFLAAASTVKLAVIHGVLVSVSDSKAAHIELYSLTGSRIAQGENYLSVRGISTGVYVAKVQTASGIYAQKVIIK
jgi:hypothetical protein